MARVEPGKGRAKIEHLGNELLITIPARKHLALMLFIPVLLAGLIYSTLNLISIGPAPAGGDAPPLPLVVGMMIFLCGVFLFEFLWMLSGREVIRISGTYLTFQRSLMGLGVRRTYLLTDCSNFRTNPRPPGIGRLLGTHLWGLTGGLIEFEHKGKAARIAAGVDEAEAKHIVGEIKHMEHIQG